METLKNSWRSISQYFRNPHQRSPWGCSSQTCSLWAPSAPSVTAPVSCPTSCFLQFLQLLLSLDSQTGNLAWSSPFPEQKTVFQWHWHHLPSPEFTLRKKKLVLREWISQRGTCRLEYLKHQSVVLIKHPAGKSQESWTQKYAALALELQMPCSGHLCFPEGLSASNPLCFYYSLMPRFSGFLYLKEIPCLAD